MKEIIIEALSQIEGHTTKLTELQPIGGGDINQAFKAITAERNYFIKLNTNVPSSFFRIEAEGINKMKQTDTVHVPEVFFFNQPKSGETGVLIQEWIEGEKNSNTASQLGIELGRMHKIRQKQYGYEESTFVGELTQPNDFYDNWVVYYQEKRLLPQLELAAKQNHLTQKRGRHLEQVIKKLDDLIPAPDFPSLLHGDLWGGNWLTGKNGVPYLIDPSIFYGDRLMEISFTELFGGFSSDFYKSYQEVASIPDYYEDVKPLYQLFYLLVHLNMFGEAYGAEVDQIVNKYAEKK